MQHCVHPCRNCHGSIRIITESRLANNPTYSCQRSAHTLSSRTGLQHSSAHTFLPRPSCSGCNQCTLASHPAEINLQQGPKHRPVNGTAPGRSTLGLQTFQARTFRNRTRQAAPWPGTRSQHFTTWEEHQSRLHGPSVDACGAVRRLTALLLIRLS